MERQRSAREDLSVAEPCPRAPSLWAATAPPAASTPALIGPGRADVCIIGGGYCGLNAALELAEAGAEVVLLEAREPGWGASGRNGGQVIPGLKYDPDELIGKLGEAQGRALTTFAAATADAVFDRLTRYRIDAPHVRAGWIQGAHDPTGLAAAHRRAKQWSELGAPAEALDAAAVARRLGANIYLGGWIDRRGGAIQPLAYARGLVRAAIAAGARLHGETRATRLTPRDGGWRVETDRGATVDARRVLVATNAYSDDLVPGLRRSFVALNSFLVATEPLAPEIRALILPGGEVVSETRPLLFYYRLDAEGRLLMGGRGRFAEPRRASDWGHLERVLAKIFPAARGARIAYRWSGRVAVTRDFLPHLHEPAPGLIVDAGCMGRGVALQTHLGVAIGRYLGSGRTSDLPLPVTPLRAIPGHAFNRLYLAALFAWYRATDGGVRPAR